MFQSLLIKPNATRGHELDMGQVVESLFFYGNTTVHLGRSEIRKLYDLTDVDTLEALLKYPNLKIYYSNSLVGVGDIGKEHFLDSFGLADLDLEKHLYKETYEYKKDETRSRKFAKKIARLINIYELPQFFNQTILQQLGDKEFLQQAIELTITHFYPGSFVQFEKIRFEIEYTGYDRFIIHTNFADFGIDEKAAVSSILALANTCEDLHVMSEFSSEISLPKFNSLMMQAKMASVLKPSLKAQKEIEVFNHFVFDESWALREGINKGHIGIKPVLKVLEKADKFKYWLNRLEDGSNLMREYQEKVEEKSILETLPLKPIRFVLFNGLGSILSAVSPEAGILTTVGAAAFDAFLLDKMIKKWKPNQFVEEDLRKLVTK